MFKQNHQYNFLWTLFTVIATHPKIITVAASAAANGIVPTATTTAAFITIITFLCYNSTIHHQNVI